MSSRAPGGVSHPIGSGCQQYHAKVSLRFVAVSFGVPDPEALGNFWAGVLGREVVDEVNGVLLSGNETQVGLSFVSAAPQKTGRNRLHLHLTSASTEDQRRTVETALRLGGRRFGTKPLPYGRHDVFLADPGGNEFCVIEPGNSYLAGCGYLGEFTCDGTREVGLFWSDALGWPIVGIRVRRSLCSRRKAEPRSHGTVGLRPPRTPGTSSSSGSPHRSPLRRPNDWLLWGRQFWAIETMASNWPIPTEISSSSAQTNSQDAAAGDYELKPGVVVSSMMTYVLPGLLPN